MEILLFLSIYLSILSLWFILELCNIYFNTDEIHIIYLYVHLHVRMYTDNSYVHMYIDVYI